MSLKDGTAEVYPCADCFLVVLDGNWEAMVLCSFTASSRVMRGIIQFRQSSITVTPPCGSGVLLQIRPRSQTERAALELPQVPPTDPLIYRFCELVAVYGTTWKELIQEEFGDGIMSAIDFDMTMERQPDQKGDRVKLGMSGKFLSYKTY